MSSASAAPKKKETLPRPSRLEIAVRLAIAKEAGQVWILGTKHITTPSDFIELANAFVTADDLFDEEPQMRSPKKGTS